MSYPDRNNPYNFDSFLKWRDEVDYYADDPFIQAVLKTYSGNGWHRVNLAAREFSPRVSFRWRDMADRIAQPDKRPYVTHFDAHNHRIDRIERPMETLVMEKEIFSEGLFSSKISPWEKLIKSFLIYQNGEACIVCPLTCTEGLAALLEKFADTPELKRIHRHLTEGIDGHFGIGAQYLSEIQGGSDVPENVLEAVKEGDTWRLYGTKFFCSATHADYAAVTAKPRGSHNVALFVVPSWLPGDKEKEIRNGCTIDRIKWKMGTSELTTSEITYDGAVAYPVGPLERGIANVVGIVLTYSRLTVGLSGAANMTRAAREAKMYGQMRDAFGLKIDRFPMVKSQLNHMAHSAQRTTAGAFKLYRDFLSLEGISADEPKSTKKKRFDVRELVMLQKITASWDTMDILRMAMSIFGGHGVMEDFSSLPRLYRDAAVNELWEGPRNVLLAQIHRDLQRVSEWYPPSEFAQNILQGADKVIVDDLSKEISDLVAYPDLVTMNEETVRICRQWDNFCARLFHAYQDLAEREVKKDV
jgi:putative acyl-CoA dehydrogenase